MKPCFVLVGNKSWYKFHENDILDLVHYASTKKIKVCTREREDGLKETGFFTWNPIKQFMLGNYYSKLPMSIMTGFDIKLTPGVSDAQIQKSCEKFCS